MSFNYSKLATLKPNFLKEEENNKEQNKEASSQEKQPDQIENKVALKGIKLVSRPLQKGIKISN